jgi:hypothetical protein
LFFLPAGSEQLQSEARDKLIHSTTEWSRAGKERRRKYKINENKVCRLATTTDATEMIHSETCHFNYIVLHVNGSPLVSSQETQHAERRESPTLTGISLVTLKPPACGAAWPKLPYLSHVQFLVAPKMSDSTSPHPFAAIQARTSKRIKITHQKPNIQTQRITQNVPICKTHHHMTPNEPYPSKQR